MWVSKALALWNILRREDSSADILSWQCGQNIDGWPSSPGVDIDVSSFFCLFFLGCFDLSSIGTSFGCLSRIWHFLDRYSKNSLPQKGHNNVLLLVLVVCIFVIDDDGFATTVSPAALVDEEHSDCCQGRAVATYMLLSVVLPKV